MVDILGRVGRGIVLRDGMGVRGRCRAMRDRRENMGVVVGYGKGERKYGKDVLWEWMWSMM